MDLKFTVSASALNAAMGVVAIVPPRPLTPQGGAGYLFVVRKVGDTGEGCCYVYTQDALHVARAQFNITDIQCDADEASFIYPAQHVKSFTFVEGNITFTAHSEGDVHTVRFDLDGESGGERASFDPKLMGGFDKDLEEATQERKFPAAILREAFGMSRPFMADAGNTRLDDQFKSIQIFDASEEATAKGDGFLFASNAIQAIFFQCDVFKGQKLAIHGQHLKMASDFLAKASGDVIVRSGKKMTFMSDVAGNVFGWVPHQKTYQKFSYYALKSDGLVLNVPQARVLHQLAFTKAELEKGYDKIRVTFDAAGSTLRFSIVDSKAKFVSPSVDVQVVSPEPKDFTTTVNIDHLISLFTALKADQGELRVCTIPVSERNPKEKVMLRTIDEFWLDGDAKVVAGSGVPEGKEPQGAFRCRVTRFMPSKD